MAAQPTAVVTAIQDIVASATPNTVDFTIVVRSPSSRAWPPRAPASTATASSV